MSAVLGLAESIAPPEAGTFLGHPKGLAVLFLTETWERVSYYGMRALLVLYMVNYLFVRPDAGADVLGFGALKHALETAFGVLTPQALSSQIYGLYTGFVYLTPFFGGMLADRLLGRRTAVIVGARADGDRPFHDGERAPVLRRADGAHRRQRLLQAEHLDPGRRPLRARRSAPRPRLRRLLRRHESRRASSRR